MYQKQLDLLTLFLEILQQESRTCSIFSSRELP